jgi:hypothetical protein
MFVTFRKGDLAARHIATPPATATATACPSVAIQPAGFVNVKAARLAAELDFRGVVEAAEARP